MVDQASRKLSTNPLQAPLNVRAESQNTTLRRAVDGLMSMGDVSHEDVTNDSFDDGHGADNASNKTNNVQHLVIPI